MATKKNATQVETPINFGTIVDVARIYSDRRLNLARPTGEYGDMKDLHVSLFDQGWLHNDSGLITVEPMNDFWRPLAVQELEKEWSERKTLAMNHAERIVDLKVWEEWHCDKDGKLKVPDLLAVSGNRRLTALAEAQLLRRKAGKALIRDVPVLIKEYEKDSERLKDQVKENEFKNVGFREPTDMDRLMTMEHVMERGGIQDDLRDMLGAGMGQRLFGVWTLNKYFPTFRLIERMKKEPTDPEYIRFAAAKPKDMPNMSLRADPAKLAKHNHTQRSRGLQTLESLTLRDVELYFQARMNGEDGPAAAKTMKGAAIKGLVDDFAVRPMAAMARAISENNRTELDFYVVNKDLFNFAESLAKEGDGPPMSDIMRKLLIMKSEDRQKAFAAISAAITG